MLIGRRDANDLNKTTIHSSNVKQFKLNFANIDMRVMLFGLKPFDECHQFGGCHQVSFGLMNLVPDRFDPLLK